MSSYSADGYAELLVRLRYYSGLIPKDLISSFSNYSWPVYQFDLQDKFSKPMPWIGMYIATASLFCILAMVADLLHGLRNTKPWFPCRYFTLNSASLTVIAVAMKLPVDLSNPMPCSIDQKAKIGSIAFMCTMMANLLPSIATMNRMELVANMISLSVLVVTLVVNVGIEMNTNVISSSDLGPSRIESIVRVDSMKIIAAIYVGMLLLLLIIYTCSSLAILKSKQMLELKYQQVLKTALKNQHLGKSGVEKQLKEYVRCYWIMARTGSPQFMIASAPTTSASGIICSLSTLLYIPLMFSFIEPFWKSDYDSSYKWSILAISTIQLLGVILGTIAPFYRCFTSLSFKMSRKLVSNHSKVFNVEKYWTQMLSEWKDSTVPSLFRSRKWNIGINNTKIILLNICIVFQKTAVVGCKIIAFIPILIVFSRWCFLHCWKWVKDMLCASGRRQNPSHVEQNEDLRRYALQIQDDIELADRTLIGISKSLNRLMQRAKKKEPNNLIKLLKEREFKRHEKFDNLHLSHLSPERNYLDCWSLTLVTLTAIAISLHEIEKNDVDSLRSSVGEGLVYVRLVEEHLKATDEYISTRKAAKLFWPGVEFNHEWLGNKIQKDDPELKTPRQILMWFKERAESMLNEVQSLNIGCQEDNWIHRSISAVSMNHITTTILNSNHNNTDHDSQRELYDKLWSMIADVLAACLTNLPQAIMMKCHTSEIEKREANVHVAAQCLGETKKLFSILEL